ncbi:MAG: methyltransferase domain-containing protein [Verrucomicrobiaceae bacterium]|nr:methyltransferase domain-containing protein [Verrucomicrobiaceae bacterium]
MASGYDQIDFWKAYCRFFFACGKDQPGLQELAASLAAKLKADSNNPRGSLNVLCLGIGVAGFEYPLLSSLQRHFDQPIRVVGLDKSANTLNVSSWLCDDLKREFKSAEDFASYVEKWWDAPHGNPNFATMDLDGRGKSPFPGKPWTGDDPSDWFKRLDPEVVPVGGFDMVIAAFCFHHVHWWRATLCNALQLLRPEGLLLLSQVDGDVSLLDWNQQETWLLEERSHEPSGPLERVMTAFWNHPYLRKHMLERGQAGAVRPWPQIDLLDRLPLDRITTDARHHYFARSTLSAKGLEAIMLTAGLSPFRRAKEFFEKELRDKRQAIKAYEDHASNACSLLEAKSSFPTANRIRWHAYKKQDEARFYSSALVRKFQTLTDPTRTSETERHHLLSVAEFELMEASAVAHDTFHSMDLDNWAFENFVEKLVLSGSLSSQTPFGVMGQRLVRQEKFSTSLCFANPLGGQAPMNELMLYMCLRQASLRDFSNSNTLLNEILPLFNVPAVFSYVQDTPTQHPVDASTDKPAIFLEVERYRSFLEIRFRISIPDRCRTLVLEDPHFKRSLEIVSEAVLGEISRRSVEEKDRSNFVIPIPEIEAEVGKEFAQQVSKVGQLFRNKLDLKSTHADFERSWKKLSALTNLNVLGSDQANTERRLKHLEKAFCEAMIESIYWLCLIPDWRQVIIYPASYSNPDGNGIRADDSLILFYGEHLTEFAIQHEFRKVSLVLDQLNMRRLATSGETLGLIDYNQSMSHELAKQTNVLFGKRLLPLSSVFHINGMDRTIDDNDRWPHPVGSIDLGNIEQDVVAEVGKWHVCPTPKLLDALKSYLFLWAGATSALSEIAGTRSISSFSDLVALSMQIASSGSVAPSFRDEIISIAGVAQANISYDKRLSQLPRIVTEKEDYCGIRWNERKSNPKLEVVFILILRALVAAFQNAFQHTESVANATISYSYSVKADGILLTIKNPLPHDANENTPISTDGTWGVIRNCLRLLDKDTIFPRRGPDEGVWKTKILIPNPARYKGGEEVVWLY